MDLPPHFANEMIFGDSFSCVAAKESKYPGVLTLKRYMAAQHVGVGIWGDNSTEEISVWILHFSFGGPPQPTDSRLLVTSVQVEAEGQFEYSAMRDKLPAVSWIDKRHVTPTGKPVLRRNDEPSTTKAG